jgi:hypothetical protein
MFSDDMESAVRHIHGVMALIASLFPRTGGRDDPEDRRLMERHLQLAEDAVRRVGSREVTLQRQLSAARQQAAAARKRTAAMTPGQSLVSLLCTLNIFALAPNDMITVLITLHVFKIVVYYYRLYLSLSRIATHDIKRVTTCLHFTFYSHFISLASL